MERGFTDTMHETLTFVWLPFVIVAVALSAVAFRGWFRIYSVGTLLAMTGLWNRVRERHPGARAERHAVGGSLRARQRLRTQAVVRLAGRDCLASMLNGGHGGAHD